MYSFHIIIQYDKKRILYFNHYQQKRLSFIIFETVQHILYTYAIKKNKEKLFQKIN